MELPLEEKKTKDGKQSVLQATSSRDERKKFQADTGRLRGIGSKQI